MSLSLRVMSELLLFITADALYNGIAKKSGLSVLSVDVGL